MTRFFLLILIFSCNNENLIKDFPTDDNYTVETTTNASITHTINGKLKAKIDVGKLERFNKNQIIYLSDGVKLKDVTDDYCVFGIFGPKSRSLMQEISKDNFSNENFKFSYAKNIKISNLKIWTQRLSYVGELGYELFVKISEAKKIYELIINKGKKFNLSNCGMHALDTMRMESGFLHWGHDISPEENQFQSGLNFTISNKKEIDFIGKKALHLIKCKKINKRFVMLVLKDNKPGLPLLLHDEPIYFKDKIIGRTTSGNYSFNFKKNLAFGYIKNTYLLEELLSNDIFIEVEKHMYPAKLIEKPLKQTNFKKI